MSEAAEKGPEIGLVQPQYFEFGDETDGLILDSGQTLGPVTICYETYGSLNADATNAILLLHAFSGDAHAAGYHSYEDKNPGWWHSMVGPGKPFDTDSYFVICSNVIGGCQGSTGPGSLNPRTGRRYGLDFPVITVHDMVKAQVRLIRHLGIPKLLAVAGGSMGGMQALEWASRYSSYVHGAIILASTSRLSAQGIAFNAVGRNAIMSDPRFSNGEYYEHEAPVRGLAIARMVGHITYLSDESMRMKFGRRLQDREHMDFSFTDQFEVESYLEYKGGTFVDRFDANSYIYLSKAIDYFDMETTHGSLEAAFADTSTRFLILSFSSDWLYPPYQSKEIVRALMRTRKDVSYCEISSPYGHDSFLLETERQAPMINAFLSTISHGRDLEVSS